MNKIRKNLKDLISYAFEEEKHINENIKLNKAKIEDLMFNDDLASNFIRMSLEDNLEGFVMPYPYGNVIKYKERFNYYRGENQIYPSSLPSLNRMFKSGDEKYNEYLRCISRLKVLKFKDLINQIDLIQSWETNTGSDVNYLALAQHYGIKTNLLDITSDLMIALFFACTVYDTKLKQYRPLNNNDLINSNYGVIYYREINPRLDEDRIFINTINKNLTIDDIGIKETCSCIYPIGYQPFYRCSFQTGYYMPIHDGDLLSNDKRFTKIIFEHDVYLSKKIFEYMNKGLSIYRKCQWGW